MMIMEKIRTQEQNTRFHAIIGKLGLSKDEKQQLVEEVSYGRTDSSRELYVSEMNHLINHLQSIVNSNGPDPAFKMRRKIFSLCHEFGWECLPESRKVDVQRLNNWMLKFGYLHKPLNSYTLQELPKLVTQFENMVNKSFQ